MKCKLQPILIFCLIIASIVTGVDISIARSASRSPTRIFILHSYEKGHVCGQPQHDGVIAALKKAGFKGKENVEIKVYYMDTKRKNNTPELIKKQAQMALDQIRFFEPDVLVTLDDNAFRSVALNLVDSNLSVVFSGMNGQPEDYNQTKHFMNARSQPGHNITGVYEKLHICDAINVHSKLFPGFKKIIFFVDPSPTGRAISKQIKLELKDEAIPCKWQMIMARTWEEYKSQILKANTDPDIGVIYPAALLLKDRDGNTYTAPEIFSWTIQNSKKVEIAVNYAFTRLGLFGGAAVDFYAMGQQAGQMVVKIIRGQSPGNIAIEDAHRYALVFNLKRAEQLGVAIPSDILMAADEVVR